LFRDRGLEAIDFNKDKEILIYVVGTQSASGINTMLDYMSKKSRLPLTAVTFDIYKLENGNRILIREITEADLPISKTSRETQRNKFTSEKICSQADHNGVGQEFRYVLAESSRLGLYPRLYPYSIMYTHPDHKSRMLFTVWNNRKPLLVWVGYEAFVDYYPVTIEQVAGALGLSGRRTLDMEGARQLVSGLEKLMSLRNSGE
jgi:hypothetical protein